jgi:hypothetical protein
MPENTDPITLTLDTLRADVERNPLADSQTVRRRGDRRTRNQAVAGAVVVVALIAGVVGLYGGVGDGSRRTAPPASVSPTPATVTLAAAPFLRPNDLTDFGSYGQFTDSGKEPTVSPQECRVQPAGWGADEVKATRFFQDGSEAQVYEYVLRFEDPDRAVAAVDDLGSYLAGCPAVDPAEGDLTVRGPQAVDGLADAVRASRAFVPKVASEPSYSEVAAARDGTVVVVLDWSASANPGQVSSGWTWDADRLQAALDRAVE